jgi:hypothetical protein
VQARTQKKKKHTFHVFDVADIDIGALLDQIRDNVGARVIHGAMQRSPAFRITAVHVGASLFDQIATLAQIAFARRVKQRRRAFLRQRVGVRLPILAQMFHNIDVLTYCCDMIQW